MLNLLVIGRNVLCWWSLLVFSVLLSACGGGGGSAGSGGGFSTNLSSAPLSSATSIAETSASSTRAVSSAASLPPTSTVSNVSQVSSSTLSSQVSVISSSSIPVSSSSQALSSVAQTSESTNASVASSIVARSSLSSVVNSSSVSYNGSSKSFASISASSTSTSTSTSVAVSSSSLIASSKNNSNSSVVSSNNSSKNNSNSSVVSSSSSSKSNSSSLVVSSSSSSKSNSNSSVVSSSSSSKSSLSSSSIRSSSSSSSSRLSSSSSSNSSASSISGLPGDGLYGVPTSTFTIPASAKAMDGSLYLIDIQAKYPAVDWANIDRLYIPAGNYKLIRIGNLPNRPANKKLVITNIGGQVKIGALNYTYLMSLMGGSNWIFTGRYDPVSKTGDINFPGHRGGVFANTQGTYGIMVDDEFVGYNGTGITGLAINGGATQFEVEFVEITRVGFAGLMAKTDDTPTAPMVNCKLHDLYIHDTGSEGMYLGSTQAQPEHQMRDWEIYNNRILRTGTEAMQFGQAGGNNHIHNNVFGPSAIDWRSAFQNYQDGNIQLTIREGSILFENNISIASAGTHLTLFALPVAGDSVVGNVGVTVRNNYFSDMRNLGMYIGSDTITGMKYSFNNNVWRNWNFEYNQVYSTSTAYDHLLRNFNITTPISLTNSSWETVTKFMAGVTMNALPTGNGTAGNVTGSGNAKQLSPAVKFVNSGLPEGFNYLRLEMWTAAASLGGNAPVSYPQDMITLYLGKPYRCKLSVCAAVPLGNNSVWEPLAQFPDDVRVAAGSTYAGYGVQP